MCLFILQLYLYGKETSRVSFSEFVNRELILFSNMDNERSIPSLVDGKESVYVTEMYLIYPIHHLPLVLTKSPFPTLYLETVCQMIPLPL